MNADMNTSFLKKARALYRSAAGALVYWFGLGRGFELLTRPGGAIVLMYHSIAADEVAVAIDPPNRMSPREFERQMAFLSRHRRVISLTELVTDIEKGRTPAAGTVCITFDDGYLDNLTVAAPILERYRLPATLFLPTAYIDRAQTQWADELHRLFSQRTEGWLKLTALGIDADLAEKEQLIAARKVVHLHLLHSDYATRNATLLALEQQLKPNGKAPRLTMNWDEVRELVRRYPGFEIGGHSRHHIDLKTHHGNEAMDEIQGCADDLRRELSVQAQHFSFPYGRWRPETRDMVQAAGWRSGIGAGVNVKIGQTTDRYVMARPDTPHSMTELRFWTSGAYPGALAMLGAH